SLRGRELMLRHLLGQGFPPPLAVRTYLALVHYVMGSVHVDDRSTKRDPADREALTALFAGLDRDDYPTVVGLADILGGLEPDDELDRKSTRLNSSHLVISYAVFCLKKKRKTQ